MEVGMAATVVVATRQQLLVEPALARSVRTLADTGYDPVVVTPPVADSASGLTLALGASRAGRRAVPVLAHVLIDPLDPALAGPPATARPEPLAVLEAESIAALAGAGFTVVVADQRPVVPHGPSYRAQTATLDLAACGRRLAGDLGAGLLVFVTGDDGPPRIGDVDIREAEGHLAWDEPYAAELVAATRFLRAGGELALLTTAADVPAALSATPADGAALRIHRTLDRPRSATPVFAAGWC
jgi:hypothetical protein